MPSSALVPPGPHLLHPEIRAAQALGKSLIGSGRPDGQDPARPQGRPDDLQTRLVVEPVVAFTDQVRGAVVHIQQNGVVSPAFGLEYLQRRPPPGG